MPDAVDLLALAAAPGADGVRWSVSPEGFHANFVALAPGGTIATHRNDEVDVLVVVLGGAGRVDVDGSAVDVRAGQAVVVPKGADRAIVADGDGDGLRYLTVHARRGPMTIGRARA